MRAKAKAVILCALLSVGTALMPARASAAVVTQDACMFIASIDGNKFYNSLATYAGPVLGKAPEHWSPADFANLLANVQACNGQPANVASKVDAYHWAAQIADIQKRNAPINALSLQIAAAYAKFWTGKGEFPACADFLKWRRDDLWYTNNSKDIFGTAFIDMPPETLGLYGRLVQECNPVMRSILDRRRISLATADDLTKSILDSIERDAQARNQASLVLPDDLVVMQGGRPLPIAYLRKTTQAVVLRFASLEEHERVMPTNALIQISKWANQLESEMSDGPDLLYARKIKDVIAQHMFNAVESMPDRGAASAAPN